MASKHWIAGIVAAAVIGVGAWVYSGAGQTAAPQSTFVLLDGSQKTTADLKGKVTLVNFWATSLHHLRGRDARDHQHLPEVPGQGL